MRTALVLLFLLAIASVPGSVLPQRGTNPIMVAMWIASNPRLGSVLDRLGFFDVFAAPWFAAVYLLLFISLVGCVFPRIAAHARAIRTPPPAAPRRMDRMPTSTTVATAEDPGTILAKARAQLSRGHWRIREGRSDVDGTRWIAAEKGYLRETGNLMFHLSLLLMLAGVAISGLFGWKGNVIVREGSGFANTLTQYDAWGGGRMVAPTELRPFSFTLDRFTVDYERVGAQRGAPREFDAEITYRAGPSAAAARRAIHVNEPLVADGAKVFLVGHGYAPRVTVRDSAGRVVFDDSVAFLPQDGNMTSTGVIKAPDGETQLGFNGLFLPTADLSPSMGSLSRFPVADKPRLLLAAFQGDLGLDSGMPQSVFALDTSRMQELGLKTLAPGETWELPRNAGSVEFTGFEQWASFQIAYDPGKELALFAAVTVIASLMASALVRRRRLWVKVSPGLAGGSVLQVAGLGKADQNEVIGEVQVLAARITDRGQRLGPSS